MQTPTAIAFRALVMLVCLIGVPLAAIFNVPIREYAQKWLDSHKPGGSGQPSTAAISLPAGASAGANQFSAPATSWNGPTASATPGPAASVVPPVALPVSMPASAATQAGYELPANAPRTVQPAGFLAPTVPAKDSSADPVLSKAIPATPAAGSASSSAPSADAVKQFERRFQDLGATYYRLETWGARGEQYRFYCLMALTNDPNQNRLFQAADPEPLRAMQNVLHDVEDWRRQRSTQ